MPLQYYKLLVHIFCNHINVYNTSTIKITLYFQVGKKKIIFLRIKDNEMVTKNKTIHCPPTQPFQTKKLPSWQGLINRHLRKEKVIAASSKKKKHQEYHEANLNDITHLACIFLSFFLLNFFFFNYDTNQHETVKPHGQERWSEIPVQHAPKR